MSNSAYYTVELAPSAVEVLTAMRRKAKEFGVDATSLLPVYEMILTSGFGGSVHVCRDGSDELSLIMQWDSGFTVGAIFHRASKSWSLHS